MSDCESVGNDDVKNGCIKKRNIWLTTDIVDLMIHIRDERVEYYERRRENVGGGFAG